MGRKTKKEEVPFPSKEEMDELHNDIKKYEKSKASLKQISAQSVAGLMGEFFDSYIVFAHDLDGNQFVLRKSDNPRDMRAINGLVEDYLDSKIQMTYSQTKNADQMLEDWMQQMDDEEFEDDDDDFAP